MKTNIDLYPVVEKTTDGISSIFNGRISGPIEKPTAIYTQHHDNCFIPAFRGVIYTLLNGVGGGGPRIWFEFIIKATGHPDSSMRLSLHWPVGFDLMLYAKDDAAIIDDISINAKLLKQVTFYLFTSLTARPYVFL
jgi:hypothetical protein